MNDFNQFFSQNKTWLVPYAAFCYLKEFEWTVDFQQMEDIR